MGLYSSYPVFVCFVYTAWAISTTPTATSPTSPTATSYQNQLNKTAYAKLCLKNNFELKDVCPIDKRVLQAFGPDIVDVDFVEEKVFSNRMVNRLSKDCPSGQVCGALWDKLAVDRVKLAWRDIGFRHQYCKLTPCLTDILEENPKHEYCQNPDRELGFRAFRLLCRLAEQVEPDADVGACTDAALELLQYNAADLRRNESTVKDVCECATKMGECVLPKSCAGMVRKYFCLSQRCSIDTVHYLSQFKLWSWYFKNELLIQAQFKLHGCDEEVLPAENTPPFVVAVLQVYGMKQAAIAATVGILISCLTLFFSCFIYKKYHKAQFIRNRNEYTEMKDSI